MVRWFWNIGAYLAVAQSVPASEGMPVAIGDDPWVGLLELAPRSQYRVPGDEALFGGHRVWVASPNQSGRSDNASCPLPTR